MTNKLDGFMIICLLGLSLFGVTMFAVAEHSISSSEESAKRIRKLRIELSKCIEKRDVKIQFEYNKNHCMLEIGITESDIN